MKKLLERRWFELLAGLLLLLMVGAYVGLAHAGPPVATTNTVHVSWLAHPQHCATPGTNPPCAPISIEIQQRVVPAGTALAASSPAWGSFKTEIGGSAPATTASRTGIVAGYGQALQVRLRACWDDPTTSENDYQCSDWSSGAQYLVDGAMGPPPGWPSGETISAAEPQAAPTTANSPYSLRLAADATRTGHIALEGASVAGDRWIFTTPNTNVLQVRFWLDNPAMTGAAARVDGVSMYDFGAAAGGAWDSRSVVDGTHSITAEVELTTGERHIIRSAFTVRNAP